MDKYSKPSLPNPRSVFEDLSVRNIEDTNETLKFAADEGSLRNAYNCYLHFKQLQNDINKQQELSSTLEELNKELMNNIENMRKQQIKND